VLCTTVVHNDTHTREQFLRIGICLRLGLGLGLAFGVCFVFSLDYFVVLFALFALDIVSSVLCQEIG